MRVPSLALALVLTLSSGCYLAHAREDAIDASQRDGGLVDAGARSLDASDATIEPVDAGVDAPPLCGCPGDPAAEACSLPEMCCPVTRTCEDPSRFRCSGSSRPCE